MAGIQIGLGGYRPGQPVTQAPPLGGAQPSNRIKLGGAGLGGVGTGGEWAGAVSTLRNLAGGDGRGGQGSALTAGYIGAPDALERETGPTPAANQPSMSRGFAKAKDASSRIGNQALQALRSQMVSRGIEGSGIEGRLTGNILGDVAAQQSDAAYQQSKMADEQAWEGAKLGYQGAVAQRGQDTGLAEAGYSGLISQRGQDLGRESQWMSMLPSILQYINSRKDAQTEQDRYSLGSQAREEALKQAKAKTKTDTTQARLSEIMSGGGGSFGMFGW